MLTCVSVNGIDAYGVDFSSIEVSRNTAVCAGVACVAVVIAAMLGRKVLQQQGERIEAAANSTDRESADIPGPGVGQIIAKEVVSYLSYSLGFASVYYITELVSSLSKMHKKSTIPILNCSTCVLTYFAGRFASVWVRRAPWWTLEGSSTVRHAVFTELASEAVTYAATVGACYLSADLAERNNPRDNSQKIEVAGRLAVIIFIQPLLLSATMRRGVIPAVMKMCGR